MKITIIGAGNIGSALVTGLLQEGSTAVGDLCLTDVSNEALEPFATTGINTMQDNFAAVSDADIIVLCIKPYQVLEIIEEIAPILPEKALLVSLAAGVSFFEIEQFTNSRDIHLFRAVPNIAMSVCQSMTCVAASGNTDEEQCNAILELFCLVGEAILVDEAFIDKATVVASCGTAFALRYLHAATAAAVEIGLSPDIATAMIAQTMLGAAEVVLKSGNHPEVEIDKVTTPGGITIKGLNTMEHAGFSSAVMKGIAAAFEKLNV